MVNVRQVAAWLCTVLAWCSGVCAADDGALKGCVKLDGEPPLPKVTRLDARHQTDCKCQEIVSEALVVDKTTKGVQWAMIRIMDVKAAEPAEPFKPVTMDQVHCTFVPHVVIVPPGSSVTFLNSDKIAHNVHTVPLDGVNRPINHMMAATDERLAVKGRCLSEPEIIQVQCDIHAWMRAYIVVHDPRFAAITGTDGKFEIKGVPAGKHKVSIFHETLGEQTLDVEVQAGQTADAGVVKFRLQ